MDSAKWPASTDFAQATRLLARNDAAKAGVALTTDSVEQAAADLNTARGAQIRGENTFDKNICRK